MRNTATRSRGFALLIAVVFMSVMLAIGLALGSLSYKQQVLASSATQSQYAFYAADAGLECALYADQQQNFFAYPPTEPASAPAITCNNSAPDSASFSYTPGQLIVFNRLPLDLGRRCADITVYKPKNGAEATYIFSQGYDVPCDTVSSPDGARFVARGINIRY